MLKITNHTPLDARIAPYTDQQGVCFAIVILKGTFELPLQRETLALAEAQVPIQDADQYYGDPDTSSVKSDSDLAPRKPGTDMVVCGDIIPPAEDPVRSIDVTFSMNDHQRTLRAFGERHWERHHGVWQISPPTPFTCLPLRFEQAFGGSPVDNPAAAYAANPLGKGLTTSLQDGLELPNLEWPQQLIHSPEDTPPPACFGVVNRSWQPRVGYAGTYDTQWHSNRRPLLPLDFDDRYYHCATPQMIFPVLQGNETLQLTNMHPQGVLRFTLPALDLRVNIKVRGRDNIHQARLDTVYLEPNQRRVSLTWRVCADCRREFLHITDIIIKRKQSHGR